MSDGISLEKACYQADVDAVRTRLAEGAPVTFDALCNTVNSEIKREAKKRQTICKLLLDAGADPNMPAPAHRASIMHVAAGGVSSDILRMLIEAGGRVDGRCLVHAAVGWDRPDNIRLLLAAGANPDEPLVAPALSPTEPIAGMTALQYAQYLRHKKCVAVLSEYLSG